MRSFTTLAIAGCLLAASAVPTGASDVVSAGTSPTIVLGRNWGPYETYRGDSFRWIANDAEINVRGARGEASLRITCEGGPSIGRLDVPIRVLDPSGRQVDHVRCAGKDHAGQLLLPLASGEARYVLHVDGGGRRVPPAGRILNVRIFALSDDAAAAAQDIADSHSGVRVGAHWYPLEHFGGQSFRWLDEDAQIIVTSDREARASIRLLAEVGPSVGAPRTTIAIRDASQREVFRGAIAGRSALIVPLALRRGDSVFTIHVDSRTVRVRGDDRILNLRVFSLAVRR